MTRKMAHYRALYYPPRLMGSEEAARYMGISVSLFKSLVKNGSMPQGVKVSEGRIVWDRLALDERADAITAPADDTGWDDVLQNAN